MFLPALVATMAFTTSALYTFWCDSIQFALQDSDADGDLFDELHFGPYYQKKAVYQETGNYITLQQTCVEWSINEDGKLKTVRALAIITLIIGGLLAIILWFRPCLAGRISRQQWQAVAAIYIILLTPMQALTFLLFDSNACRDNPVVAQLEEQAGRVGDLYESDCAWDQGSTANVFGAALWLGTGLAMLWVGEPQRPDPQPPTTQTVTYQRETQPDGTVAVQEVAVVKGIAVPSPDQKV